MATANNNTTREPTDWSAANDAAYAIRHLGDLLRQSSENGGFEGLEKRHWTAIGIAIEQLAKGLERGALTNPMEREAAEQSAGEVNR